jgi:hypothetical protein
MVVTEITRLIRSTELTDVLDELDTLDDACGRDDRFFRYRVRTLLERRRLLLSRPSRLQAEVGRD